MMRLRTSAAVILACATLAGATTPAQVQFRTETSGVSVYVTVTSDRRPVTGLRAADFVLTDSGVAQSVTAVSAADVPVDLSLVVQDYLLFGERTERALRTQLAAVAGVLHEADRLRVVTFGELEMHVSPLVSAADIDTTLAVYVDGSRQRRRVCSGLDDAIAGELMRPNEAGRQHIVLAMALWEGTGNVTDANTLLEIAKRSSARAFVLKRFLPSPVETTSYGRPPLPCGYSWYDWSEPNRARLRTIGHMPDWRDGLRALWDVGRARLIPMAEATGGGEVRPSAFTGSIAGSVRQVLEETRTGYVLYYTPTGVPASGWHPIVVKVNRPGPFEVHARPGYSR